MRLSRRDLAGGADASCMLEARIADKASKMELATSGARLARFAEARASEARRAKRCEGEQGDAKL